MNKITVTKEVVNAILANTYTAEGIALWWNRSRHQLGGKTPLEVFEDDPYTVFQLAVSALSQTAT